VEIDNRAPYSPSTKPRQQALSHRAFTRQSAWYTARGTVSGYGAMFPTTISGRSRFYLTGDFQLQPSVVDGNGRASAP